MATLVYIRINQGMRGLQGQDSIDTTADVVLCEAARDAAIAAQVGAEAARDTAAAYAVTCADILAQIQALP